MGAAIKLTVSKETHSPRSTFPLIWLDSTINSTEENLDAQKSIRSSIDQLKTFEKIESCEEYLRSLAFDERIIIIVSGRLGREITPRIHSLRQVSAIFVYCFDKPANEQWARQYKKVSRTTFARD